MRFFQPFRPLLKGWLLSFVVFGAIAAVLVGQVTYVFSLTWEEALRIFARDWLPWALLAPLLFRLVDRCPLERERLKLALPVMVLAGLASVAFCIWWAEEVIPPRTSPRGPLRPGETRPAGDPRASGEGARNGGENAASTEAKPPGGPNPSRPLGEGREWRPSPRWRGPQDRSIFDRFLFFFGFRFPTFVVIVSVAHAFLFYRRAQDRERRALELQASLAQARLEALKMQLQPHFLFNALNAIAALIHRDPEAADEMLAALSDLLRMVLETSGAQELPLRREVELVERYLAIEHARFGDRLRYEVDLPREAEAGLVPAFLLQPLVENAVRHGLEPRPGSGLISIRAERQNGTLRLIVQDDGVGLDPGVPAREGIGLANTRARLQELYRGAAHLEMRSERGVEVEITLPYHVAPR